MPGVGSAPPSAPRRGPPSPLHSSGKSVLTFDVCGNLGPERASHLSRDTQLLSEDLSLGPHVRALALKCSWNPGDKQVAARPLLCLCAQLEPPVSTLAYCTDMLIIPPSTTGFLECDESLPL